MKKLLILLFSLASLTGSAQVIYLGLDDAEPYLSAGADLTITTLDSILISARTRNLDSLVWRTDGTGTFTDSTAKRTYYTPSYIDSQLDSMVFTLVGYALDGQDTIYDEKIVYLSEDFYVWNNDFLLYETGLTTPLNETQRTKVNDFCDCIHDGFSVDSLSDVFDVAYWFVNQTQEAALRNLVKRSEDATNQHSTAWAAATGFTGDGANDFINTNYNPTADADNYLQNSASFGVYTLNSLNAGYAMGGLDAAGVISVVGPRISGNIFYSNNDGAMSIENPNSIGLHSSARTASNVTWGYKGGGRYGTANTNASTGVLNRDFYLLGRNVNNAINTPSAYQIAFSYIARGLTQAELIDLTECVDDYIGYEDIELYFNSGTNDTVGIVMKGEVGAKQPYVDWGDGTATSLYMDGDSYLLSRIYATPGLYTIHINYPEGISYMQLSEGITYNDSTRVDLSTFFGATNLDTLMLRKADELYGVVDSLPTSLLNLQLGMWVNHENETGDLSHLVNALRIDLGQPSSTNVVTCDFTDMASLQRYYLNGTGLMIDTVSLHSDLIRIEGNGTNKYIYGDITDLADLEEICSTMEGYMWGEPGDACVYLDIENPEGDSNGIAFDLEDKPLLQRLVLHEGNNVTGGYANASVLSNLMVKGNNMTKLTRLTTLPVLSGYIAPASVTYTSAEVNQILADLWANRDNAFVARYTQRSFDLRGAVGSGAPTGQGIIDKAALQNYRSPGDNPAYSKWTILTR